MIDKQKQGKKNRQSGAKFELKVRADLESRGWIVDRWTNNVDLSKACDDAKDMESRGLFINRLIKAKSNRFNMRTTGFPDFIAFKRTPNYYKIVGVECKSNGYLDKEEKAKCKWLLDNKIFSKIFIASKDGKEIVYKEFDNV